MCYELPITHRKSSEEKSRHIDLPASGKVPSARPAEPHRPETGSEETRKREPEPATA